MCAVSMRHAFRLTSCKRSSSSLKPWMDRGTSIGVYGAFAGGYLLTCVLLFPSVMRDGRIWAEEGNHFLRELANSTFLDSLFYLHKQHLDFFPNLASAAISILPLSWAPRVFPAIAVIPIVGFSWIAAYCLLQVARLCKVRASLLLFLSGCLAASSLIGQESLLNTINSWAFVVAGFGLLIPVLTSYPFWIGLLFPLLAFPCVLFLPWVACRALIARARRPLMLLCGLATGSLVQFLLIFVSSLGQDQPSGQRSLDVLDLSASLWLLLVKLPLFLLQGQAQIFEISAELDPALIRVSALAIVVVGLVGCVCWIVFGSGHSALARLAGAIGTPLEWLPVMVSWQIFAFVLALHGAYVLLLSTGGSRYYFSSYLVLLVGLSALALGGGRVARWLVAVWFSFALITAAESQHQRLAAGLDVDCLVSRPVWVDASQDWVADRAATIDGLNICPRGWRIRQGRLKTASEIRDRLKKERLRESF